MHKRKKIKKIKLSEAVGYLFTLLIAFTVQIGRASCRERV